MIKKDTVEKNFYEALNMLKELNPEIMLVLGSEQEAPKKRPHVLQKVLVANRGEIAKRFFFALHEEGIPSVAVVTEVDKGQSWYEFADEVVFIGTDNGYTNISVILAATILIKANAIYAGYGFLSENADFVEAIDLVSNFTGHKIVFMGPNHKTMRLMGDKISSRELARQHDIPVFESSGGIETADVALAKQEAERIGYPVIIKLSAGGGGKGMYVVRDESEMQSAVESCYRIGKELYQNSCFYLEKYIKHPIHIEVQVFNGWAIAIRKCAVQRNNQKIIEESGHTFLKDYMALSLLSAAERIAMATGYSQCGAGTVEFLIDVSTGKFGFMEMNTRLQVEYGVTDQSLNIDLVRWQILYFDGREEEIVGADVIKYRVTEKNHAIECRIYAEEPENDYRPSPGIIQEMVIPTFNGIRCDFGFGAGDKILSMYDPMIGKLIARGANREETLIRMERALQELYIKGVRTNINQLLRIVRHPAFINPDYTNNLLQENPDLNFQQPEIAEHFDMNPKTNQHILFGAFAEHIKLLHQTVRKFMVVANNEGVIDNSFDSRVPCRYGVEYQGQQYTIEFLQVSLDMFHTYINGIYNGKIILGSFNDRSDNLLVTFRNRSKRIRVDRQGGFIVLRMRDEKSKINYYRMSVVPEGVEDVASIGIISSPFQGTFVAFVRDNLKIGDPVSAGEPLLILSAMKMETTIVSSIDGRITYIIENGDLSRLQLAKTLDGRIIGKSLQEGEVLMKIEPEANHEEISKDTFQRVDLRASYPVTDETFDIFSRDNFDELILQNVNKHLDTLIELFQAAVRGFVPQHVIEKLELLLEKIPPEMWNALMTDQRTEAINAAILHYTYINRLFSPAISSEGFSFPEELHYFAQHWRNPELDLSALFASLLKELFSSYGLANWAAGTFVKEMQVQHLFLLLKWSYQFWNDHWPIVRKHVHILGALRTSVDGTFLMLKQLLACTQADLDDSSSKFIRKMIAEKFPEKTFDLYSGNGKEYATFIQQRYGDESLRKICAESLKKPETFLISQNMPYWIVRNLRGKLAILEKHYTIQRLATETLTVIMYRLQSRNHPEFQRYVCFAFVDCPGDGDHQKIAETAVQEASAVISAYQRVEPLAENWIEIIFRRKDILWNVERKDRQYFDVYHLKQICSAALASFDDKSITWGLIEARVRYPFKNTSKKKQIAFYEKDDAIVLDMLYDSDRRNPYCREEEFNPINQRLFENDKWPIELWAEQCFDPGSIEEIKIPTVDPENPDDPPVGSKIYVGTMNGVTACFYMKDFRVLGGSTGSREGLKYLAATYLSYLKGWPLYVWNDGAGANIKQGVVALNRGAEGFTMNSLLAEQVDPNTFQQYVTHVTDPDVRNLFQELNRQFHLMNPEMPREGNSMLVTVGIGASAGLDVYGSSQATIQVMLDSEMSYRVLTGSNVIKSVMGEDISNYEIGGAKILGKWTGIADIIAADKLELISYIHKLHRMFCTKKQLSEIQRLQTSPSLDTQQETPQYETLVFSETVMHSNVDYGEFFLFKREYYGSNALIAGFAKIAGRRVFIMGPRTNTGLRSTASMIKARELLKVAYRTSSPQMLIFGKKWYQRPHNPENNSMRAWLDFMETLQNRSGIRIHIITDIMGLKRAEINSTADVIIFVQDGDIPLSDRSFAEKNATWIVKSFEEAFDLSAKLIELIDPLEVLETTQTSSSVPAIPADKGEPFEIIESVIEPVFDDGSFVEFYRKMNQPSGPNLVTGLAKLNGMTVGIIADQPQIKGGGADAPGAEKFRIFMQFLNRYNIPLVMLSNSSGFVPGSQQERYRIQAIGAESLDTNILGHVPVVSVVLNQVYGGRQIQAFSKYLRPGVVCIAHENACIAVMGEIAAFDLLCRKKYRKLLDEGKTKEAEELQRTFIEQFLDKAKASNDAANTEVIDWTFPDVKNLREHLLKGFELAIKRCQEAFQEARSREQGAESN